MSERAPYERLDGESRQAFAAFVIYRDMEPTKRSIDTAWRSTLPADRQEWAAKRRAPGHWTEWSSKHRWRERAAAYDAHMDELMRRQREEKHLHKLAQYQERQARLAAVLVENCIKLLKKAGARLDEIDPSQIKPDKLPAFFRAAAAVSEQGTNAESQALSVQHLLERLNAAEG